MTEPDPQALQADDAKLVALARAARVRTGAATAAAVRDATGRSYVGTDVTLPSLRLTGIELAVAQAVAAGAVGLEAAVIVASDPDSVTSADAATDLGPSGAPVFITDSAGVLVRRLPS